MPKIHTYPVVTTPAESDVILVETPSGSRKLTVADLRDYVNS